MLVSGLRSTSGDRPSNPSNESQPKYDKRPPKSSKNEILIFISHSTSDDWLSNPSNESRPKCDKRPPKWSNNEMLIFGLHSTSDDWPCNPSNKSQLKCGKRPPKSLKNEILIFILHSTSDDRPSNPSDLLFQSGSSLHPPHPPDGKVGIRVAKKLRFFRFTFNKFQPKDNSVQSLLHLLAMQLICDGQCTNWFTLHFYNL